jgi:signal transduction histidine kinase
MAHRLLNSVNAIQGLCSRARTLLASEPPELDEVLELLEKADARAVELTEQLTHLAKGLSEVIDLDELQAEHRESEGPPHRQR